MFTFTSIALLQLLNITSVTGTKYLQNSFARQLADASTPGHTFKATNRHNGLDPGFVGSHPTISLQSPFPLPKSRESSSVKPHLYHLPYTSASPLQSLCSGTCPHVRALHPGLQRSAARSLNGPACPLAALLSRSPLSSANVTLYRDPKREPWQSGRHFHRSRDCTAAIPCCSIAAAWYRCVKPSACLSVLPPTDITP